MIASVDSLAIATATLMIDMFQRTPLALHATVAFHLYLRLSPLDTIVDVSWDQIGEEQCVGSFGAVFGTEADEQQVHAVGLVEFSRSEHMPPAKRQQASTMALLHGVRHRWHGDAYSGDAVIVVAVDNHGYKIEIQAGIYDLTYWSICRSVSSTKP